MAPTVTDREKLLKQARGLSYLRTGEMPRDGAFDAFNDVQLRSQLREYRTAINENWDLDSFTAGQDPDAPVSFGVEQPAAPVGTKDRLIELIEIELRDGGVLPPNDATAVKSVMSIAGYDVDLDSNTFSAQEEAALGRFRDNIDMFSLQEMANRNFAAAAAEEAQTLRLQQEQEALALSQAELKGSVASMLVYAGYLAPEDADNDKRIASAMNHAITIFSAHEDQVTDQQKMFVDFENWQLTDEAAIYLRTNMDGFNPQNADLSGELLRSHLESGDPNLIKLAQGYLINQPGNEELEINGVVDQATFDAGLRELQQPLGLPAGVYDTDGTTIRGDRVMQYAVDGQLYLPVDQLSAEDRALYDSLPFAADRQPGDVNCKERLLASRLILEDPEGYAQLLEAENARRTTAVLDVPVVSVVLPDVAVAPGSTAEEERDVANNPLGVIAVPGDTALDQPLISSDMNNAGIGQTDQFGLVVYETPEAGMKAFLDYVSHSAEATDGKVTLMEAMVGLHYSDMSMQEALVGGPTAGMDRPPQQHADRIAEMIGQSEFNINDPADRTLMMTALVGYTNRDQYRETHGTDFIQAVRDNPELMASIRAAAGDVTPSTAPAVETPEVETPVSAIGDSLVDKFSFAHDAPTVNTDGAPKTGVTENDRRLAAALTGANGPTGMA